MFPDRPRRPWRHPARLHRAGSVVGSLAFRVGLAALVGVFLAGILVPVHRDGVNCGSAAAGANESLLVSGGDAGRGTAAADTSGILRACHDGTRYRAVVLGAFGALAIVVALQGTYAMSRRRHHGHPAP